MKTTLIILLGMILTGCGGSSSSGGGNANNDVTSQCLVLVSSGNFSDIYRNNCDFDVNAGQQRLRFAEVRERITLRPGQTISLFFYEVTTIIACRLPSIPIIVGEVQNGIGGNLACS